MNKKLALALLVVPALAQAAMKLDCELTAHGQVATESLIVNDGDHIVRKDLATGVILDGCAVAHDDKVEMTLEVYKATEEGKELYSNSTLEAAWGEAAKFECPVSNEAGETVYALSVTATQVDDEQDSEKSEEEEQREEGQDKPVVKDEQEEAREEDEQKPAAKDEQEEARQEDESGQVPVKTEEEEMNEEEEENPQAPAAPMVVEQA